MNNIALFGGTFDPFHLGHLNLALTARRECRLDKIIFIPNYISPFKTDSNVTSGEIRCEMIERILHYDDAFSVSRYEITRESPSYTFDTLEAFGDDAGGNLSFIIGYDSLLNIDTWYRGKEIISKYHLIAGRRPDYDDKEGLRKVREYEELYGARVTLLGIEPFRASSTEIREYIRDGKDVSAYLPPEITEYIEKNGLYR